MRKANPLWILTATLVVFSSCAGPAAKMTDLGTRETLPEAASVDSQVDITYVLGHNEHRLVAETRKNSTVARTYLDRHILEENPIDQTKYIDFLQKASTFITHPRDRGLAQNEACQTPFKVTVRIGKNTHSATGCRTTNQGLSRLVEDGEFLLYSKK